MGNNDPDDDEPEPDDEPDDTDEEEAPMIWVLIHDDADQDVCFDVKIDGINTSTYTAALWDGTNAPDGYSCGHGYASKWQPLSYQFERLRGSLIHYQALDIGLEELHLKTAELPSARGRRVTTESVFPRDDAAARLGVDDAGDIISVGLIRDSIIVVSQQWVPAPEPPAVERRVTI